MNYSQAVDYFILNQELSGNSEHTIRNYRCVLGLFGDWVSVNNPLLNDDISRLVLSDVNTYHIYLKSKKHSITGLAIAKKTVQSYIRHIKAFVSFCFREELISGIDFSKKIRLPKVDCPVIQILTDDEILSLLNCLNRKTEFGLRDYVICCLMLDCGFRAGDVCNLHISDVNFNLGYITVRNGKGNKGRVVPVGLRTRRVMSQYLYTKRRLPLDNDDDFFFLSASRRPLNVYSVVRIFKRLKSKSGITRLHAHLLRHTFATNYILSGLGDIHELSQILGHSDLKTTQIYLHTAGFYAIGRKKNKSYLDKL